MTWTEDDQRRWEMHRAWELAEQAEDRLVRSLRRQRRGLVLLGGIIAALIVVNIFLIR